MLLSVLCLENAISLKLSILFGLTASLNLFVNLVLYFEGRDLIKTHVGLSVPKSLTICTSFGSRCLVSSHLLQEETSRMRML